MVAAMLEAAVVDKRIPDNPARGIRVSRADPCAVDEDEIPTLGDVDLIAEHIAPQYRLAVYLQSGTGQRPCEALAFSAECRRSGYVRVRWQVSAKAHRDDCRTVFVPLKHRAEGEYRDVPAAPFIEQEIDDHLSRWEPVPVAFTGQRGQTTATGGPLRPAPAWQGRDAHRLHLRLPLQEGVRVGRPGRCGRQGQVRARQSAALLRLDRVGERRTDLRGLAMARA